MKSKKILIPGGCGFIGTKLNDILREYEILNIDNLDPLIHGEKANVNESNVRVMDWASDNGIKEAKKFNPDVIILAVSQTGTYDSQNRSQFYIDKNIKDFQFAVSEYAKFTNLEKVILLSSRAVYGEGVSLVNSQIVNNIRHARDLQKGEFKFTWEKEANGEYLANSIMHTANPVSVYGTTKLTQEFLFKNAFAFANAEIQILRLQNIIGPGQSLKNPYTGMLCWFAQAMAKNNPVELYEGGEIWRDFLDVRDVAYAIKLCVEEIAPTDLQDIGSGIATKINTITSLLREKLDSRSTVKYVNKFRLGDIRFARSGSKTPHQFTLKDSIYDFVDYTL